MEESLLSSCLLLLLLPFFSSEFLGWLPLVFPCQCRLERALSGVLDPAAFKSRPAWKSSFFEPRVLSSLSALSSDCSPLNPTEPLLSRRSLTPCLCPADQSYHPQIFPLPASLTWKPPRRMSTAAQPLLCLSPTRGSPPPPPVYIQGRRAPPVLP